LVNNSLILSIEALLGGYSAHSSVNFLGKRQVERGLS
jgi:hypothetical protein